MTFAFATLTGKVTKSWDLIKTFLGDIAQLKYQELFFTKLFLEYFLYDAAI